MKILLLTAETNTTMSYLGDWEDAFQADRRDRVHLINIHHSDDVQQLETTIGDYDLIVGLHSLLRTSSAAGLAASLGTLFDPRPGVFVSFVGDEVNLHNAPLAKKLGALRALAPDYVATQLPYDAGCWLYEDIGPVVIAVPHALNESFWVSSGSVPRAPRRAHLGAISVRYPVYLGDNDRNRLFELFSSIQKQSPSEYRFTLSQSTAARLNRAEWRQFLYEHEGTISCEAGTHYLERDDATVLKVVEFVTKAASQNGMLIVEDGPLRQAFHMLPKGARDLVKRLLGSGAHRAAVGIDDLLYSDKYFVEVFNQFFADYRRLPFETKAISSRHFEAIGARTCQILIEGHYNGILQAGEHFIPLAGDFSNIQEALRCFFDESFRTSICERALDFALTEHTFGHRVRQIKALA